MKLSEQQKDGLMSALYRLMAAWSEDHYAAGWMSGLEDDLPFEVKKIINQTERNCGYLEANALWAVASLLGHWMNYEGEPYTPNGFTFD